MLTQLTSDSLKGCRNAEMNVSAKTNIY